MPSRDSNDVVRLQRLKVTFGHAEHFTVNCLVVLSKIGCASGYVGLRIKKLDGVAGNGHITDDGVVHMHEHLTRPGDVLVFDNVPEHIDRCNRNACRVDDRHALGYGMLRAPLLYLGLECGMVLAAVNVGVKARIAQQILSCREA